MRARWWAGPSLAAAAALLTACGSSPADPPASGMGGSTPAASVAAQTNAGTAANTIRTRSTSHGTVLVDAAGRTLYWFAKDTPKQSSCHHSCAVYWPPVLGSAAAGTGMSLPHGFGTITRADGKTQATYDGHPLYTYAGDTAPGQVNGNGVKASGGKWWAVTPTGARLRSPMATSSSGSSGGGGSW